MKYKKEQYNKIKFCQFADKDTESEFLEHCKPDNLVNTRIMLTGIGLIYLSFIIAAYIFLGIGREFYISLGLRSFCMLLTVITSITIGLIKQYRHTIILVTIIQLVIFAIYLLDLQLMQSTQYAMQYLTVMIFILVVFITPNIWKNSILAGILITASYIIFSFNSTKPDEIQNIIERGIYLFICLAAFTGFMRYIEISRRKQYAAEKMLEHMSFTDRLTNIYNRGRFEHILNLWIKNKRHDPFCLAFFDIDHFKKVNDTFGHNTGDNVLTETAEIISSNIRDDDIFARWGGEEFVILFGNIGIERAIELAERLRTAVENKTYPEAGKVTISIGVTRYRRGKNNADDESMPDFIKRADDNMYAAKKNGRNRVVADSE